MKTIRKTFGIVLLNLLLLSSAYAGIMPGGVIDPPPPSDSQQQSEPNAGSLASQGGDTAALDSTTATVLDLLQSVLALF